MIGLRRARNLRQLCSAVLRNRVPGDFAETGVWRGGACILMRAVLRAFGETSRRVFVADSFAGLPPPDPDLYPQDSGDIHHTYSELIVSEEEVRQNFLAYDLLDDQVVFLKGWFRDTLPQAPIDRLAILRLDGDMYESTMDALRSLYPKLSPGGYCIVDDGNVPNCRQAITDYLRAHSLAPSFVDIDG
jgi:O-methyltransferase